MVSASENLNAARGFVWLTARVLEQRRFEFLFAAGGPQGVLLALDAYRCSDGGYGYGLEPDLRGPVSQPLATHTALTILDEIGMCQGDAATAVCDYLASITCADGGVPAVDPHIRDYPRAPFLPLDENPPAALLTTALIASVLYKNKIDHSWLGPATQFCWRCIDEMDTTHPYEVHAAVAFLDHVPDRARAGRAAERLGELVRRQRLVVLDPQRPEDAQLSPGYAPGELHHVIDYVPDPSSVARSWFSTEEIERGLDALASWQEEDGGWPIRWREWSPATSLESRPAVTIGALLALRAHGRL